MGRRASSGHPVGIGDTDADTRRAEMMINLFWLGLMYAGGSRPGTDLRGIATEMRVYFRCR